MDDEEHESLFRAAAIAWFWNVAVAIPDANGRLRKFTPLYIIEFLESQGFPAWASIGPVADGLH